MQCFYISFSIFALFWLSIFLGQVNTFKSKPSSSSSLPSLHQWNNTSGNYYEQDGRGGYVSRVETPSGIIHFEIGYLRRTSENIPYQVKEGYYIYPTSDGRKVRLSYFADHRGFRVISYNVSRKAMKKSTKPTKAK